MLVASGSFRDRAWSLSNGTSDRVRPYDKRHELVVPLVDFADFFPGGSEVLSRCERVAADRAVDPVRCTNDVGALVVPDLGVEEPGIRLREHLDEVLLEVFSPLLLVVFARILSG